MTPYEIDIVLWYYVRVGDHPDIQRNPPVWRPTVDGFIDNGLLLISKGRMDVVYVLSERGRAYVEALQRVRLPVQTWVMPGEAEQ